MKVRIIAELCQNHLGDRSILRRMVDAAADAGATHVKIQHIYTDNLVYRPQFETGLKVSGVEHCIHRPFKPEYDRLKPLELDDEIVRDFVAYARQRKVVPMTTCFARRDIETILKQGFSSIKVASYDCASYTLLRELAANFEELVISTGATFDDEIKMAAKVVADHQNISFLHCVTLYPTPLDQMHLNRMIWLKRFCSSVGLSDHSLVSQDGVMASKVAIAMGASLIERHFTILDVDKTKDGPVSIRPDDIVDLVRFGALPQGDQLSELDSLRPGWSSELGGVANRSLSDQELLNRDYYRGRFASPREIGKHEASRMVFNWEETPI